MIAPGSVVAAAVANACGVACDACSVPVTRTPTDVASCALGDVWAVVGGGAGSSSSGAFRRPSPQDLQLPSSRSGLKSKAD